jgi:hypothetical protein
MRINYKILSLPPYISTSWKNVVSLHVELESDGPLLLIALIDGQKVVVPNLEPPIIEAIFHAHAKFLEQEQAQPVLKDGSFPLAHPEQLGLNFPLKIAIGGLENLGNLLQHNPAQADTPPLPEDILNKIVSLTKNAGIDDPNMLPTAEPHCNCVHCQIARAIHGNHATSDTHTIDIDEEVSEEDLKFRTWNIVQTGDKLFALSNPLDEAEKYNVFLGNPVGCTCGEKSCEHILAVLRS